MSDVDQINALAQFIRVVDGNHTMGRGALAEAILEHRAEWDTPRIIRTREELEALDPDTVVWPYGYYDPYAAERLLIVLDGPFNDPEETVIPLPIAVIRDGAEVRAAREALEKETE